jgi:hypothetical protein
MQMPVWIEVMSKLAVPSIALLGAVYTALQYGRAKRWKAGDLAVTLIGQLEKDEELTLACRAIDWGVGPLVVPQRYRALLERGELSPVDRGEVMKQDPDLMARAVKVGLAIDPETEPRGARLSRLLRQTLRPSRPIFTDFGRRTNSSWTT